MLKNFVHYLDNIKYPSFKEESEELWNVSGVLKNRLNEHLKYDTRTLEQILSKKVGKKGNTKSKADKIVFETNKEWVIIDVQELHKYIKKQYLKIVQLEDLLNKLEWNIVIPKK